MNPTIRQRIKLRICGYYKDGYDYYSICNKHGLTIHVVQGYEDKLYCKKCFTEYRKEV